MIKLKMYISNKIMVLKYKIILLRYSIRFKIQDIKIASSLRRCEKLLKRLKEKK